MSDLKDQIRTYYEATTTPVDVDAIAVDEGLVLVGPFPDAVWRKSAMKTMPKTSEPGAPRWRGPRVALTAFAVVAVVVVAVLASVSLFDRGEVLTPGAGGDDPQAVVEAYIEAYNDGDIDAVMALFSEKSVVTGHPFLLNDGMWEAAGLAAIRALQVEDITAAATENPYAISNVEVTGDTVTWDHVWVNSVGVQYCTYGNRAVVGDGKILSWSWPGGDFECR